jgi:hypothetical protein
MNRHLLQAPMRGEDIPLTRADAGSPARPRATWRNGVRRDATWRDRIVKCAERTQLVGRGMCCHAAFRCNRGGAEARRTDAEEDLVVTRASCPRGRCQQGARRPRRNKTLLSFCRVRLSRLRDCAVAFQRRFIERNEPNRSQRKTPFPSNWPGNVSRSRNRRRRNEANRASAKSARGSAYRPLHHEQHRSRERVVGDRRCRRTYDVEGWRLR